MAVWIALSRKCVNWMNQGSPSVAVGNSVVLNSHRFVVAMVKLIPTSVALGRRRAEPDYHSEKFTMAHVAQVRLKHDYLIILNIF